jgi:hypothetical protein
MRWHIIISGCNGMPGDESFVDEYSLGDVNVTATGSVASLGGPTEVDRRTWEPRDHETQVWRDVAYRPHAPTINWWGNPTTSDWQGQTQCLNYIVTDGDYYIVGTAGEHFYEPAAGFQTITFTAGNWTSGPLNAVSSTNLPGGCLQIPTNQIPNGIPDGINTLTANATVAGKPVTAQNPDLHIDNTPPTGSLASLGPYAHASVTVTGNMNDASSGPGAWALQVNGPGTNGQWQDLCHLQTTPQSNTLYSCPWNTAATRSDGTPVYPDGNYQLQAKMFDNTLHPGPNWITTPTINVLVDNTPPVLANFAPALGQQWNEGVSEDQVDVEWTQTDATSGIASTTVEYNTGTNGSCSGSWVTIGNSSDSGDSSVAWNTVGVPSGLVCLHAVAVDHAGNTREYRWQTILATVRPSVKDSNGGTDYGYAGVYLGSKLLKRKAPGGRPWYSYGVAGVIRTPNEHPQYQIWSDHHPSSSALWVGTGVTATSKSVQVGLTTEEYCNHTKRSDGTVLQPGTPENWDVYGEYGLNVTTRAWWCPAAAASGSQWSLRTQLDTRTREGMFWRPAGARTETILTVQFDDGTSPPGPFYQLAAHTGAQSSAAKYEEYRIDGLRGATGHFSHLRYNTRPGSTGYVTPDDSHWDFPNYAENFTTDAYAQTTRQLYEDAGVFGSDFRVCTTQGQSCTP